MRLSILVLLSLHAVSRAQEDPYYTRPDLSALAEHGMQEVLRRYSVDLGALRRFWDVRLSPVRRQREREFLDTWAAGLDALDFEAFGVDDRIDWLLLANRIRYTRRSLALDEDRWIETRELLPFAGTIIELQEARRTPEPIEPSVAAGRLDSLREVIEELLERVHSDDEDEDSGASKDHIYVTRSIANRAASQVRSLRKSLGRWFRYYSGYDPLFSWWCADPYGKADEALGDYAKYLRERVAGVEEDDKDTILGDPIGRKALLEELGRELIPYTPEELVAIAEKELAWCDAEMQRASQELDFGDDWRAAQEHVKTLHVSPGKQPELIRLLAQEAVDFLESHELLTIPPFAKNAWRMEMMTPERQALTPYFTGGEVISVSFPTSSMPHGDKLMSMRGNNVHFSRATVHHELIPGHHLQQFMNARYRAYRSPFSTPFWGEGWALYWEMLLWDEGFAQSPEDRIGMLFWRKHRCARILFSLGFHLGELSADECIELLVERIGHERVNATAEVRRSVQGGYGPLYQAAYMLGGLQFRALHRELVQTGERSERAFHDAILREGSIPVELVRAKLSNRKLPRDYTSSWRFYGN